MSLNYSENDELRKRLAKAIAEIDSLRAKLAESETRTRSFLDLTEKEHDSLRAQLGEAQRQRDVFEESSIASAQCGVELAARVALAGGAASPVTAEECIGIAAGVANTPGRDRDDYNTGYADGAEEVAERIRAAIAANPQRDTLRSENERLRDALNDALAAAMQIDCTDDERPHVQSPAEVDCVGCAISRIVRTALGAPDCEVGAALAGDRVCPKCEGCGGFNDSRNCDTCHGTGKAQSETGGAA